MSSETSDVDESAASDPYDTIPFDAICTGGCGRVKIKRARPENVGLHPQTDPLSIDTTDVTSFKHVCHVCGKATWWNPVAVLKGLIRDERGRSE